jgi:diadenosine tetraphosphate (Ap4A) HIT family hydrolase
MPTCQTCELVARRDAGKAPPWDRILRTPWWDVVHAFGTSIEGWTVLVLRRHASAVSELTDDEVVELGPLIRDVSRALESSTGCPKTYVAQFAEHPDHPHVHVHVIPRPATLDDRSRGPRVFDFLGLPPDRCVPETRMDQLADQIATRLTDSGTRWTRP